MSSQPYSSTPPESSTGKKTILIIIVAVVVLCCLCTVLAGAAGAAYYFLLRPAQQEVGFTPDPQEELLTEENTPVVEPTPEPEDTPLPENTPTPQNTSTPQKEPTVTLAAQNQDQPGGAGLGVSREEMMAFYSASDQFEFGEPSETQGMPYIMGTHTWLCIDSNCAAVTLGGPEEDLEVISIVVPTDPDDGAQTTLGILLLMTTAARFADSEGIDTIETVPAQVMQDIQDAQAAGQNLEKQIENSGYIFTVIYDAATHNAGLAVSRPR